MLKTVLCDVLGIDVPIILGPMAVFTSPAPVAAAVSNSGGLGSIGTLFRATDAIKRDIDEVQELTNRNYAVNYIPQTLDAEAFRHALAAQPAVISFALGDPGDLVRQAHDAGSKVMVQVTTVAQATEAAEPGVDVVVAQGGESGGFGGNVSTMALVPQVVDAVSPIPVVAAGGIFDGRGIAAALMLGAVGVNLGTRFLASKEATIEEEWKQAIVAANSEDAVKIDFLNDITRLALLAMGQFSAHCARHSCTSGAASARRSLRFGSAYPRSSQQAHGLVAATTQFFPVVRLPAASKR